MAKRIIPLLAVLAAVFWSRAAEASHFRYGSIAWTVPNPQTAALTVKFTVTAAWRSTSIGNTTLDFGDGVNNGAAGGSAVGTGTDSLNNAYTVQQYTATHTYAAASVYTAFFQSSARVAGLQNGASASFRVETKVALAPGNTGGPVSASTALIQMQVGAVRTYAFPSFDPDGDPITCRFATTGEMWSTNPADGAPPAASQNIPTEPNGNKMPTLVNGPSGCVVSWDLTLAAPGKQYVLHIVLESTHGGLISSTAIDLIIETVTPPPPTCAGTGMFTVNVGQAFSTSTTGTIQGGGTLVLNATNAPSGSAITPPSGGSGASPLTSAFTWSPPATFAGTTQIVIMNYTNSGNNISGACFLTLQVPQCSNFGAACSAGVGECKKTGTNVCAGPGVTVCSVSAGAPTAEVCDGKDNDCDGAIDNGSPGSGAACASGLPGVCSPGITACTGGALLCNATITPGTQTEVCDGQDNDCDGAVDNGNPGGGAACVSGLPGVCSPGTTACSGGAVVCNATIIPDTQTETCDGLDNDCDGAVDNGNPGGGVACVSAFPGVCSPGTTACFAGAIACNPIIPPGSLAEACDGIDNDCDGLVDNGNPGGGVACPSGLPGVCAAGTTACAAGAIACNANIAPGSQAETCDGKDNDCDGAVDNGNPGSGVDCASGLPGVCAAGKTTCAAGAIACTPTITPGSQAEACDGKDNDCDGAVDNGNPGGGVACASGLPGVCAAGTTACAAGAIACKPNIAPGSQTEACDGKDNNCNGTVDEGFVLGAPCSAGVGACVAQGVIACDALGAASCNAVPGTPGPEVCSDFLDNDCNGVVNNGCLDSDGDGLLDDYETLIGTDPHDADSDDDGVLDGQEPNLTEDSDGDGLINALDPDSDNDGLFDGTELGKDCSDPATDTSKKQCIPDGDAGKTKTNPLDPDTDHGSVKDGVEDANHNGVVDPGETDPEDPADDISASSTGGTGGAGGGGGSTASSSGSTGGGGGGVPDGVLATGSGFTCSAAAGSGDSQGVSWLLGGALAMLVSARRRRRAA